MKKLLFLVFFISTAALAHPGIGIVKDSKGNIFYSDLKQVWKIANGKRSVAVPHVHTHELYLDRNDNLYGEGTHYEAGREEKFYQYMWVLRPDGRLDTAISMREAYVRHNFSLARDAEGNEYFTRAFLKARDTNHIYVQSPGGKERIFATGNFKGVSWLHPQKDASLLYVRNNTVFRIDTGGTVSIVARNIGSKKPSFRFSGKSITVWGVWEDADRNVYVAVFSDQAVKKISPDGTVSIFYRSKGNWAPTHGVFDDSGKLWLLESSDKNNVRVVEVKG